MCISNYKECMGAQRNKRKDGEGLVDGQRPI